MPKLRDPKPDPVRGQADTRSTGNSKLGALEVGSLVSPPAPLVESVARAHCLSGPGKSSPHASTLMPRRPEDLETANSPRADDHHVKRAQPSRGRPPTGPRGSQGSRQHPTDKDAASESKKRRSDSGSPKSEDGQHYLDLLAEYFPKDSPRGRPRSPRNSVADSMRRRCREFRLCPMPPPAALPRL